MHGHRTVHIMVVSVSERQDKEGDNKETQWEQKRLAGEETCKRRIMWKKNKNEQGAGA